MMSRLPRFVFSFLSLPRLGARFLPRGHAAFLVLSVGVLVVAGSAARAEAAVADLWPERLKTVVAVEYTTETELERRPAISFGVVADDEGLVVLPGAAVSQRFSPDQLQDWRVYRPGQSATEYSTAEYLGRDAFTGWHFIRIAESGRAGLRPITDFLAADPAREPQMTEEIWGIGLRKKDENFLPYFLQGRVSLVQALPMRTAIALTDVAAPGLPAFNAAGEFVGLAAGGFGESYIMLSNRFRGGQPIVLINGDESAAVQLAPEIVPYLERVPANVFGRPMVWLGANGVEPLDPEVAKFLNLEGQAALVISEVLEASPAAAAGLQPRDILLAIDGRPLPTFKPDRVVAAYLDREIDRRQPGDTLNLTVLRGSARVNLAVTLTEAPKTPIEAERHYFEKLGLTVREFVFADGVNRRQTPIRLRGVVAHFVKANTPVATAGLQLDDWILEIDGQPIKTFADAVERLTAIEADAARNEFVLLASRGGETSVMRVKLR